MIRKKKQKTVRRADQFLAMARTHKMVYLELVIMNVKHGGLADLARADAFKYEAMALLVKEMEEVS